VVHAALKSENPNIGRKEFYMVTVQGIMKEFWESIKKNGGKSKEYRLDYVLNNADDLGNEAKERYPVLRKESADLFGYGNEWAHYYRDKNKKKYNE
jgi:hypothetical protein